MPSASRRAARWSGTARCFEFPTTPTCSRLSSCPPRHRLERRPSGLTRNRAVTFRRRAGAIVGEGMKRLLATAVLAGILSACAGVSAAGLAKSETPQQSLGATGKAMSALKSVRFDANGTVEVTLTQE